MPNGGVTFGVDGAGAATDSAAAFAGGGIDVPYSPALNPESFTVTAWAKPASTAGAQSLITSRYDKNSGADVEGYILYNLSGTWSFWTGDGDPGWATLNGPAVQVGTWQHLAISYDATTIQLVAEDGQPIDSVTTPYAPRYCNSSCESPR